MRPMKAGGFRRARREDIHRLLELTSGPSAGRIRALRRLLKTLEADIYVVEQEEGITGCVAVLYRRSLTHGGLVGTIDTLTSFHGGQEAKTERRALLDFALGRAQRRGCVAIDATASDDDLQTALQERGFDPGGAKWVASLRDGEESKR